MPTQSPIMDMECAGEFLAAIDVARKTELTYRGALLRLAEFLSSGLSGTVPISRLQEDTLAKFRQWLSRERRYSRQTQGTYLAGAVRFVEWLDANSRLPLPLTSSRMKLVLKGARGRRRSGYKTQPIKEAVPLIVDYYDKLPLPAGRTPRLIRRRLTILRNRAIVHLLFAAGLRAQELASLRRSDCADGANDKILITGKGDKERVVPLNTEAKNAIRTYVLERDRAAKSTPTAGTLRGPLFVRHDREGATPITTKTVWLIISQAARALGLETTVSPHDFRRYMATAMLSEGMPLESVQAFLGHESIVTTRTVYAHTWPEVLDEQVQTYRPALAQALERTMAKRRMTDNASAAP